jgi:hypothetical protein
MWILLENKFIQRKLPLKTTILLKNIHDGWTMINGEDDFPFGMIENGKY